jgi:hypothetical protein
MKLKKNYPARKVSEYQFTHSTSRTFKLHPAKQDEVAHYSFTLTDKDEQAFQLTLTPEEIAIIVAATK